MNRFHTVAEAVNYITSLPQKGSGASLVGIKKLLAKIQNPQDKLSFIHIAGSNGKGSCAKYLSDSLTKCGYKTGLFISPYILEFRERISIDGQMIKEDRLIAILNDVVDLAEKCGASQFELITAIAFLYYQECETDIVVLETGLGGRFDATNVVDPLVSVIMQISLDHTELLGDSLSQIAFEKAGIIKEGKPVVIYPDNSDEVNDLLKSVALQRDAKAILTSKDYITLIDSGDFGSRFLYKGCEYDIKMQGIHQVYNVITAIETLLQLANKLNKITNCIISKAISETRFVARFEVLRNAPLLILDGAHNEGGGLALAKTLENYPFKFVGVFSAIKSKNYSGVLRAVSPYLKKIYIVEMDNPRAENAEMLRTAVPDDLDVEIIGLSDILEKAAGEDTLVFGSLYLCSDLRNLYSSRK